MRAAERSLPAQPTLFRDHDHVTVMNAFLVTAQPAYAALKCDDGPSISRMNEKCIRGLNSTLNPRCPEQAQLSLLCNREVHGVCRSKFLNPHITGGITPRRHGQALNAPPAPRRGCRSLASVT